MNETDSSNKSLAVPAEIDLNGGTLPAVFWTAGDRLYPRLERFDLLPCPRCRELMRMLPKPGPVLLHRPDGSTVLRTHGTDNNPHAPTLDHLVPLARGGTWDHGNLRVVCRRCNYEKGTRYPPPGPLWTTCPNCDHPGSWHYRANDPPGAFICQIESAEKGREWYCFP